MKKSIKKLEAKVVKNTKTVKGGINHPFENVVISHKTLIEA